MSGAVCALRAAGALLSVSLAWSPFSAVVLPWVLLLAALAGHAVFWVGVVNRIHGLGLPRRTISLLSLVCYGLLVVIPLAYAVWLLAGGRVLPLAPDDRLGPAHCYLLAALVVAMAHVPAWLRARRAARAPAAVVRHHTRSVDVAAGLGQWPIAGLKARLLSHVPGNQLFHVDVDEEEVALAGLPPALAGLSILHLSDFHFSGRIGPVYFREVVRLANELRADMLAVTGDICDVPGTIDWIGEVFGRFEAPLGKFFVLGNHDRRVKDVPRLRAAMVAAGFVDVAAASHAANVRGRQVLIVGNERPWFDSPAADSLTADSLTASGARPDSAGASAAGLKILLSHSPDQFAWARQHGFQLMLAGHTHGGQVCLPGLGPIVCPSLHGIRYAGGTFCSPPTLLHVSRGISSLFPLRLACPCEMTKLVLRPAGSVA